MDAQISNLLIALIPSCVGVLGIITTVITTISKIKKLTVEDSIVLKRKLVEAARLNIKLCEQNEDIKNAFEDVKNSMKVMVDTCEAQMKAVAEQNKKLIEENETLKELAVQDAKVKQQLTAMIKKAK